MTGGLALFNVVESTPAALVLENRGTRLFVGTAALAVAGIVALAPFGLDQKVQMGGNDVTLAAQVLLGVFLLWGVVGVLDRQRIVFDASGTVAFTSRMRPWAGWRRPLAELAAVEVDETEESYYSSDPGSVTTVTYHLHLRFRDGFRREVNRSGDAAFIRDLAARLEGRRG
jgi:hypothetical protein